MSKSLSSNPSTAHSKSPSQDADSSQSIPLAFPFQNPLLSHPNHPYPHPFSNQFSIFSLLCGNAQPQQTLQSPIPLTKRTFNPLVITTPDMNSMDQAKGISLGQKLSPQPEPIKANPPAAFTGPAGFSFDGTLEEALESLDRTSKDARTMRIQRASKKIQKEQKESPQSPNKPVDNEFKPKKSRNSWSQAEDAQLVALIDIHGKRWAEVARIMTGRTGKQVRDRYLNVLTPNINKGCWTPIEDQMILALHNEIGAQWCRIAEYLHGRTESQVKNRFYTYLKKKCEKAAQEQAIQKEQERMRTLESVSSQSVIKIEEEDLKVKLEQQQEGKQHFAPERVAAICQELDRL